MMVAAFLLTSPYPLLDFRRFLADFTFESRHLAQGHGIISVADGVTTSRRHCAMAVGIADPRERCPGFLLLLWRDRRKGALVAPFPVCPILVLGSGQTVFARYMLPVVPFLCLGWICVTEAARWLVARLRRPDVAPILVPQVSCLLWPSVQSVIAFDQLMTLDDNRLLARRWVERHFPEGTTIAQLGSEGGQVSIFTTSTSGYTRARSGGATYHPISWSCLVSAAAHAPRPLGMERMLATDYELGFDRSRRRERSGITSMTGRMISFCRSRASRTSSGRARI